LCSSPPFFLSRVVAILGKLDDERAALLLPFPFSFPFPLHFSFVILPGIRKRLRGTEDPAYRTDVALPLPSPSRDVFSSFSPLSNATRKRRRKEEKNNTVCISPFHLSLWISLFLYHSAALTARQRRKI